MSRRSAGVVGVWAETQRAHQRQIEAEARQRREADRQARARQRQQAQDYREYRTAEARRRTRELDEQVVLLQGLLAAGCRAPAFRVSSLTRVEDIPPFDPGQLGVPVRMPDARQYQAQGSGWSAARRAQAQAEAQARYRRDRQEAQAAEARRRQQLAAHHRAHEQWAEAQRAEVRRHNAGVEEVAAGVGRGEPDAVVEYFTAALYSSTAWPEDFPRQVTAAFDPAARELVLDWELPGCAVVPEARSVRYMYALDQDKEAARPVTQRRALYREVLAQSMLLVLRQLFAADEYGVLHAVTLNGFVDAPDPATGRQGRIFLATVVAGRTAFAGLHLEQVDAVSCLTEALKGQLAARPDQLASVRPNRRPGDVAGRGVAQDGDEEPDLHAMDPVAFEELVAELFRAMGMRAVTTQRSNDGGVDVEALDPAPIRGGKIVVQVKRYRNTVPPTAVRDLYGTVQDVGANKGVLVTTSGFGPASRTFAEGKPLELVSGADLVDLLHRHGLRGRLGDGSRRTPSPSAPQPSPSASSALSEDHNVLGMDWAGDVALDVCALVCRGNRVLGDDHFVFYNNPRTPDGCVRVLAATPPDRAAIGVCFDALPRQADRLVLVAAVDPEADPGADLSGFTDARIRLLDAGRGELGSLEVFDGRPRETALVLGSFRRRGNDDWDFVVGGKGYPGGLEQLVRDFGIEVDQPAT